MSTLLKQYDDINVVYCENDNEAFGAIEAIEDAGYHVGSDIAAGDIMVMSFDGVNKEVLSYLLQDKISYVGECNPNQGPKVQNLIQTLEAGKTPDKYSYMEEHAFAHDATVPSVEVDGQMYPVTVMTKDKLKEYK
jgi:ABC-type sugar transport system substrate-binding protein